MSDLLRQSLDDIERRLRTKRLFDTESASISLRVPGQSGALFAHAGDEPRIVSFSDDVTGDAALHACVYQARPDVGGIVVGTTMWMAALAALGVALTLIDADSGQATTALEGTSRPGKGHKIYPYLLKGLEINRPNQVWCTDITYIRLPAGFVYLDEFIPDIELDIRYHGSHNFIGKPIAGYGSATAILSIAAATALRAVQAELADEDAHEG